MSRRASFVAVFVAIITATAPVQATDSGYVVVSLVAKGDPYEKAGATLAKLRNAKGMRASAAELDSLLPKLKKSQPKYVAFVARPEQIDVNLTRKLFQLATRIDRDPFVDFAYGVITGHTPEDAIRLAEAGKQTESKPRKPQLGILGVANSGALKESQSQEQLVPLPGITLPLTWATTATDGENHDHAFVEQTLLQFQSKSLFAFAGHGYPDGIVGGPKYRDLRGRNFSGAVAYNVACYAGVTKNWYQTDFSTSKIEQKQIEADESFCLNMLKTGVAGYVAYACPRPAGPEMFADMLALATEGISIGEQRRRQANSVVLTHLGQDLTETGFEMVHDGQTLDARSRSTDEIVRGMSTGSLLFGDPATKPFRKTRGAYPVETRVRNEGNGLRVDVKVAGPLWHWFCSDQLEQANMKIETRIAVAASGVKSVTVKKLPFGESHSAKKVTAAIETHGGKHFLHVKAAFRRPDQGDLMRYTQGVTARFSVELDSKSGSDQFLYIASAR